MTCKTCKPQTPEDKPCKWMTGSDGKHCIHPEMMPDGEGWWEFTIPRPDFGCTLHEAKGGQDG